MSDTQQKNDSTKVKKAFEKNLGMLTALLSGDSMFKPPKADNETVTTAIAELVKEEKEQLVKDIVAEARKMIQNKREFDKFVTAQKKELETKVQGKQKEFNEQCKTLWQKIKDVQGLEKSYYDTIKNADKGTSNPEPEEEKTDEE